MFEWVSDKDKAYHLGPVLEVINYHSFPDLDLFATREVKTTSL